ncbi:hypothetical protein RSP_0051 [Pseudomonas phage RSP]|nr:hypothetical protein RSP_0051 [Pseudomonas phage RSP]
MDQESNLPLLAQVAGIDFSETFRDRLREDGTRWNPYRNDADAFDLMLKANARIVKGDYLVAAHMGSTIFGVHVAELLRDHNNDANAAARLALCRAVIKSHKG